MTDRRNAQEWATTRAPQIPDVPSRILKRAQYEAFAFEYMDGDVRVRNESYADPENHRYLIEIDAGRPVACTCPADAKYDYPCKHRVALSIRRPILEFVEAMEARQLTGVTRRSADPWED